MHECNPQQCRWVLQTCAIARPSVGFSHATCRARRSPSQLCRTHRMRRRETSQSHHTHIISLLLAHAIVVIA